MTQTDSKTPQRDGLTDFEKQVLALFGDRIDIRTDDEMGMFRGSIRVLTEQLAADRPNWFTPDEHAVLIDLITDDSDDFQDADNVFMPDRQLLEHVLSPRNGWRLSNTYQRGPDLRWDLVESALLKPAVIEGSKTDDGGMELEDVFADIEHTQPELFEKLAEAYQFGDFEPRFAADDVDAQRCQEVFDALHGTESNESGTDAEAMKP